MDREQVEKANALGRALRQEQDREVAAVLRRYNERRDAIMRERAIKFDQARDRAVDLRRQIPRDLAAIREAEAEMAAVKGLPEPDFRWIEALRDEEVAELDRKYGSARSELRRQIDAGELQ